MRISDWSSDVCSSDLLGRGPGEGTVKAQLPDAHSDFIFAVAGEEMGLIACLIILGLFAFVVLRGFSRLLGENSLFVMLAASGLLVQLGLQAFINMASTLHLMPTKGMTLPFLRYGGSSLLALAPGMGLVLALPRARVGGGALSWRLIRSAWDRGMVRWLEYRSGGESALSTEN